MPEGRRPGGADSLLARAVLRLRWWQLLLNEDLKRGRFAVPVHLAIGHEAIAAALSAAMEDEDRLLLTHRNAAYNLARAGALEPVRREYELSPEGAAGGRLGSMNLSQPARGVHYTSSILGNNLPVACGMALADRMRGAAAVTWVVTGDGAIEEGAFWESLIFARSHGLPVVFVVENNDHSLASTIAERRCPIDLAAVSGALGIPFNALEHNHAGRYKAALEGLRRLAASGPAMVEVAVRTFSNHAGPTPGWPADPKQIRLSDGLIVEDGFEDPAWVARHTLELGEYEAEYEAMRGALGGLAGALRPETIEPREGVEWQPTSRRSGN